MTRVYLGVLGLIGINLATLLLTGPTTHELARIDDVSGEVGDEIVVDVVEPLAQGGDGDYSVMFGPLAIHLSVPDPRMLRDLEGPFHLRARIVDTSERGVRLEALAIAPLELPAPVRIDPRVMALWDGHYVEFDDDYASGFEGSVLQHAMAWLDGVGFGGLQQICEPPRDESHPSFYGRVRVRGFVHAHGHYGHLRGFDVEVAATSITYLDHCKPRLCRLAIDPALPR